MDLANYLNLIFFCLSTYRIIIICSCLPMKLWINSTKELDDTGYIVFEWLTYLPWNVCGIKRHTHAGKSQVCKAFPRNLYVVCHWFVFCCNKVSFFIFLRGLSSINFLFGWPYSRVKGFPILGQKNTALVLNQNTNVVINQTQCNN